MTLTSCRVKKMLIVSLVGREGPTGRRRRWRRERTQRAKGVLSFSIWSCGFTFKMWGKKNGHFLSQVPSISLSQHVGLGHSCRLAIGLSGKIGSDRSLSFWNIFLGMYLSSAPKEVGVYLFGQTDGSYLDDGTLPRRAARISSSTIAKIWIKLGWVGLAHLDPNDLNVS